MVLQHSYFYNFTCYFMHLTLLTPSFQENVIPLALIIMNLNYPECPNLDLNCGTRNLGLAKVSIRLAHLPGILRCYTYIRWLAIAPPAGFPLSRTNAPSSVNAYPRVLVRAPNKF